MTKGYLLTKSKYIRGLQCEKALYLEVHNPKLARFSPETLQKFRDGRTFEKRCKDTFPGGVDISRQLGYQMSRYPLLTAQLLRQEGEVTLFEAGFLYDDVLVLADVVRKHADGRVEIFEIKNSLSVTDTFRNDVAIQHYVVSHSLPAILPADIFQAGLELSHFYLLLRGEGDGLRREDLLEYALGQSAEVGERVARFKEVAAASEPDILMSDHCDRPYECPFKHYCRRQAAARQAFPADPWR